MNHTVGTHEILYCGALLEKFRVGGHIERHIGAACCQSGGDSLANECRCADGYGALGYQKGVFPDIFAESAGNVQNIVQIGRAVLVGRGAHRRKHDFHPVDALGEVRGERQPALAGVAKHHFFQAGLVDGDYASAQTFYFLFIDVDTRNIHPHFGETSARNETDITGAYYSYFHTYDVSYISCVIITDIPAPLL